MTNLIAAASLARYAKWQMDDKAPPRPKEESPFWWRTADDAKTARKTAQPKPGDACPSCHKGTLAYDSLFFLICPVCGKIAEGGTCT